MGALAAEVAAVLAAEHGDSDARATARALVDSGAAGDGALAVAWLLADEPATRAAAEAPILSARPSQGALLQLLAGRILVTRGEVEGGRGRLEIAARANPPLLRALSELGDLTLAAGDPEGALAYYGAALAAHGTHPRSAIGAAEARLALGRDSEVSRRELDAIDADPGSAPPRDVRVRFEIARARVLAALGDPGNAAVRLSRAAEKEGESARLSAALAEVFLQSRSWAQADAAAGRAVVRDAKTPELRVLLARARIGRGRYVEALQATEGFEGRAIRVQRAIARYRLGQWTEAKAELERTGRDGKLPADAAVWFALVDVASGRADRALPLLEKLLQASPPPPLASYAQGRALEAVGRKGDAEVAYRAAADREPLAPEAPAALGRLLLATGRGQDAVAPLERAVKLDPSDLATRRALGEARLAAGHPSAARADLDFVLLSTPRDVAALRTLSAAWLAEGQPARRAAPPTAPWRPRRRTRRCSSPPRRAAAAAGDIAASAEARREGPQGRRGRPGSRRGAPARPGAAPAEAVTFGLRALARGLRSGFLASSRHCSFRSTPGAAARPRRSQRYDRDGHGLFGPRRDGGARRHLAGHLGRGRAGGVGGDPSVGFWLRSHPRGHRRDILDHRLGEEADPEPCLLAARHPGQDVREPLALEGQLLLVVHADTHRRHRLGRVLLQPGAPAGSRMIPCIASYSFLRTIRVVIPPARTTVTCSLPSVVRQILIFSGSLGAAFRAFVALVVVAFAPLVLALPLFRFVAIVQDLPSEHVRYALTFAPGLESSRSVDSPPSIWRRSSGKYWAIGGGRPNRITVSPGWRWLTSHPVCRKDLPHLPYLRRGEPDASAGQVEVPEEPELVVHRLVHPLGAAGLVPQPRARNLRVPLQHHTDAIAAQEVHGEGDGPLDVLQLLPWQPENEGEVRLVRHAMPFERPGGVLEDPAGRALPDAFQTGVVAALGAHEELAREPGHALREARSQHVRRPRIENQARRETAPPERLRDLDGPAGPRGELVVHDVDEAADGPGEVGQELLEPVHEPLGRDSRASSGGRRCCRTSSRTRSRGTTRATATCRRRRAGPRSRGAERTPAPPRRAAGLPDCGRCRQAREPT